MSIPIFNKISLFLEPLKPIFDDGLYNYRLKNGHGASRGRNENLKPTNSLIRTFLDLLRSLSNSCSGNFFAACFCSSVLSDTVFNNLVIKHIVVQVSYYGNYRRVTSRNDADTYRLPS